jgi:hypothetical protein
MLKHFAIAVAVSLCVLTGAASADTFTYPDKNPIVSITFPDTWKIEPEDEVLHSGPPDGSIYFGFIPMPLGTKADKAGEMVGEIINTMVTDYKAGEDSTFTVNGIEFFGSDAKAKQRDTGDDLNVTMLFFVPDQKLGQLFAVVYFGSPESEENYEDDLMGIFASIKRP